MLASNTERVSTAAIEKVFGFFPLHEQYFISIQYIVFVMMKY